MVKHKNLNAIISTEGGNNYYVGRSIPQVLLMHPVLKYLVALKEEGKLEMEEKGTAKKRIFDGIGVMEFSPDFFSCNFLLGVVLISFEV